MDYHFSYRTKNGSVCLILSYKVGKKWRQKTRQGFKTQREARQHQDELLEEVKRSEGLTTDVRMSDMSLRQFFDIFYRDKKDFLSYNTILNYRNAVESLGAAADIPLRELTTADILNALLIQDVAVGTKKAKLRCVSPVLGHAVTVYKILAVNPARGIALREERGPKVIRAFTRDELSRLTDLLEQEPICRLVVILAANTGMRFGEIAGLPWDAIGWTAQTITVRQQYTNIGPGKLGIAPCKTRNSNRTIPAPPVVLKALAGWKRPSLSICPAPSSLWAGCQISMSSLIGLSVPIFLDAPSTPSGTPLPPSCSPRPEISTWSPISWVIPWPPCQRFMLTTRATSTRGRQTPWPVCINFFFAVFLPFKAKSP